MNYELKVGSLVKNLLGKRGVTPRGNCDIRILDSSLDVLYACFAGIKNNLAESLKRLHASFAYNGATTVRRNNCDFHYEILQNKYYFCIN